MREGVPSASGGGSLRHKGLSLAANDVIAMPLSTDDALDRVAALLAKARRENEGRESLSFHYAGTDAITRSAK